MENPGYLKGPTWTEEEYREYVRRCREADPMWGTVSAPTHAKVEEETSALEAERRWERAWGKAPPYRSHLRGRNDLSRPMKARWRKG